MALAESVKSKITAEVEYVHQLFVACDSVADRLFYFRGLLFHPPFVIGLVECLPELAGKGPSAHVSHCRHVLDGFGLAVGTQDEKREIVFGFQDIAEETAQTFFAV
ncbi:MAG: hypothetical protein V8Q54_04210 [Alistipes senegalensis]